MTNSFYPLTRNVNVSLIFYWLLFDAALFIVQTGTAIRSDSNLKPTRRSFSAPLDSYFIVFHNLISARIYWTLFWTQFSKVTNHFDLVTRHAIHPYPMPCIANASNSWHRFPSTFNKWTASRYNVVCLQFSYKRWCEFTRCAIGHFHSSAPNPSSAVVPYPKHLQHCQIVFPRFFFT